MSLKEELLKKPDEIKKQEQNLVEISINLAKTEKELQLYYNKKIVEVSKETDENNKQIFTNEIKREVEANSRLSDDKGFIELQKTHETLSRDKSKEIIELNYLINTFKALKLITMLECKEVDI